MGPMTKMAQFRMVRAITQAGMSTVGITIVGSMFLVINVLPQAFPVLEGIWDVTFNQVTNIYMLANYATISSISLYFLIAIAFEYARILSEEDEIGIKPINAVQIALFSYLMLIPQLEWVDGVISLASNPDAGTFNGMATAAGTLARFGSAALFVTFIVSFYSVRIYALCVQKHIVIKLPDVVPAGVANSFTSLVPVAFVAIVNMLIQGVLFMFGTNIFDIIAIPFGFITYICDTLPGLIIIQLLIHLLWVVGIHGASIIGSFYSAIALANMAENAAGGHMFLAGDPFNPFVYAGGSGATLCLAFMLCFMAKSEQLKAIGKAEIVPALFNINEPILFGLPIVYNPNVIVPFIAAPVVCVILAYFEFQVGLISPIIASAPWCTPGPLNAFLGTGGHLLSAAISVVNILVAGAIWFPFFKRYDNNLYKEEQEKLAAEQAAA